MGHEIIQKGSSYLDLLSRVAESGEISKKVVSKILDMVLSGKLKIQTDSSVSLSTINLGYENTNTIFLPKNYTVKAAIDEFPRILTETLRVTNQVNQQELIEIGEGLRKELESSMLKRAF